MDKIKVCFVSTFAYPLFDKRCKAGFGGAEVQLVELSKRLKDRFRVSFIVGDFGQGDKKEFNGIKIFRSFKPKRGIVNYARIFFDFWKSFKNTKSDVYIQRSTSYETFLTGLFCKIYKKKFIYMVAHDIDVNKDGLRKMFGPFVNFFFNRGLSFADLIICQNRGQQKNLMKYKGRRDSIVMKKGIDVASKMSSKKNYALWVGRCVKWKQPELFIELAKKIENMDFLMICPQGNDKKYFDSVKNKTNGIENLKFLDFVAKEQINEHYSKAKVFVLTSRYEGDLPMTVLESLAVGTPIVSLNVNPDNVFKNKFGFYCKGDAINMEKKIRFLSSTNKYEDYSKKSIKYMKENHDIGMIGKIFGDVIERLRWKRK
ncbi:glycosyltransferase [Candidatus Woesearchaeota archaeon]|nr:glycosyltransferase [Candidatus Woesearchaeota archaeon]